MKVSDFDKILIPHFADDDKSLPVSSTSPGKKGSHSHQIIVPSPDIIQRLPTFASVFA